MEKRKWLSINFLSKPTVKYPKVDLAKIEKCSCGKKYVKCSYCKNYVDLTQEGWDQDKLPDYSKSNDHDISSTTYTCNHCKVMQNTLLKANKESTYKTESFSKIQIKLESINKELSVMQDILVKREKEFEHILSLNEKIHDLEKRISCNNSSLADPLSQQNEREYQNQYIRRNRVVIMGVPKGVSDTDFITNLHKELKLDQDNLYNIKKAFRIKAKNIPSHKTLPLNVEFRNFSQKIKMLNKIRRKVYSLPNDSKFKNIKIFPDRTFKQREQFKFLKHEMKTKNQQLEYENISNKKFIIKNMTLIKINVTIEKGKLD